jgi:hypothetical protein
MVILLKSPSPLLSCASPMDVPTRLSWCEFESDITIAYVRVKRAVYEFKVACEEYVVATGAHCIQPYHSACRLIGRTAEEASDIFKHLTENPSLGSNYSSDVYIVDELAPGLVDSLLLQRGKCRINPWVEKHFQAPRMASEAHDIPSSSHVIVPRVLDRVKDHSAEGVFREPTREQYAPRRLLVPQTGMRPLNLVNRASVREVQWSRITDDVGGADEQGDVVDGQGDAVDDGFDGEVDGVDDVQVDGVDVDDGQVNGQGGINMW